MINLELRSCCIAIAAAELLAGCLDLESNRQTQRIVQTSVRRTEARSQSPAALYT